MAAWSIRRMRKDDADAVSRLLKASWLQTYEHLMGVAKVDAANAALHTAQKLAAELDDDRVMAFVATDKDGAILGHAMAKMDANGQVWLERLHVASGNFGSGLAADLMRATLAAHAGLASIALEVIEGNDRAIAFYRKHGFFEAERRNSCGSVTGVPTIVMRKLLPRA